MIRRDDGDDWLLISQVDHAHLAGEVAAAWGNAETAALPHPEWLVPAVRDHDEGWRAWERAPRVDPAGGIPRDFTEMPMEDATAIWSESIACCARVPFGDVWVSRHFCHLAQAARESRQDRAADVAAIDRFLAEQQALQANAARKGESLRGNESFEQLADEGYRWVQLFDHLSLYLCCAPRTKALALSIDDRCSIRCVPQGAWSIGIEPYPLSVERLELSVAARRIPARKLRGDDELLRALAAAPVEELRWTVSRA